MATQVATDHMGIAKKFPWLRATCIRLRRKVGVQRRTLRRLWPLTGLMNTTISLTA